MTTNEQAGGEAAFPQATFAPVVSGLTKREYFAAAALASINCDSFEDQGWQHHMAAAAFQIADAMLAESRKTVSDKCPVCGTPEVEADTPRTVYACGSSDYDQRPGTFKFGPDCPALAKRLRDGDEARKAMLAAIEAVHAQKKRIAELERDRERLSAKASQLGNQLATIREMAEQAGLVIDPVFRAAMQPNPAP